MPLLSPRSYIFPTYLFPGIPFRRRSSSTKTTTAATSTSRVETGSYSISSLLVPETSDVDTSSIAVSNVINSSNTTSFPTSTSPQTAAIPLTATTTAAAAKIKPSYLTSHTSLLRCSRCLTHLCSTSQIISKGFTGHHGQAYLVAPPPVLPPKRRRRRRRSSSGSSTSSGSSGSGGSSSSSSTSTSTSTGTGKRGIGNHANPSRHTQPGDLPNTHTHKPVPRQLVTGAHTVSDISCAVCGSVLGWKYVAAEDESQRYKVGKYILETKRVMRDVCWENGSEVVVEEDEEVEEEVEEGEVEVEQTLLQECKQPEDRVASPAAGLIAEHQRTGNAAAGSNELDDDQEFDDALDDRSERYGEEEDIEFDSEDEDECEDLFMGIWSEALARKRRQEKAWRKE